MAKPTFASCPPAASSSTSTRHLKASSSVSSHLLDRSSRSRPPRSHILALLSAISATPLSVHAYPLDPPQTSLPFLYPPFILRPTPIAILKRLDIPSTSDAAATANPTSPPPAPSSACQYDRGGLPDKFEMGDDGFWYKTHWSLYGSAHCPVSGPFYIGPLSLSTESPPFSPKVPCTPPPAATDKANGDISDPGRTVPLPPSFSDDFDFSSLPTGWTSFGIDASSHRGTVVALGISVALALTIVAMMFTCIFWKRKHVPKRDPEKRRRKYSGDADDDSVRSIREAKVAQRKWSKAASRWRDNLRLSAHRRRTNRAFASFSTLAQEEGIHAGSFLSRSRSSSPTLSERSVTPTPSDIRTISTASPHSSHSRIQSPRVLTFTDLDPPPSSPPPAQPPAYDPSSSSPHIPFESTYSDRNLAGTSKAPLSSYPQSQPRDEDDSHLTSLSGHVATDDKAILSLRAALASAPPDSNSNIPPSASVPSMENEDTFEWPSGSRPSSPGSDDYVYEPHPPYSPPTSMLPPPPSKGKQRFDYSHDLAISVSFDSVAVEPSLGPSAPPFEECEAMPSAPPLDFGVDVPSAPPQDFPDTTCSSEHSTDPGATAGITAPVVPSSGFEPSLG